MNTDNNTENQPLEAAPVKLTPTGRVQKECVRIFVLKNPADRKKSRAVSKSAKDFTCIYLRRPVYDELLALADNDPKRVRTACQITAARTYKRPNITWTATVLSGARRLLTTERAELEAFEKEAAAANNAFWSK